MAEATTTEKPAQGEADAATETKARGLGWVPEDQFRGDKARWVDAKTFVQRGEEIMPILKQNNQRLEDELRAVRGQLTEAQQAIKDSQQAVKDLLEYQTEATLDAVKRTKKDLRSQLTAAREAQNFALIEEIEEQLDEAKTTETKVQEKVDKAKAAAKTPEPTPAPKGGLDPEFVAWHKDNAWFGVDKRRSAQLAVECQMLREDPANARLVGRAFFDKALENVDALLNPKSTHSRVDTGTTGGPASAPSKSGSPKGWSDLPQEARDVCNARETKFVGKGKPFKTKEEWQKHYITHYFAQE